MVRTNSASVKKNRVDIVIYKDKQVYEAKCKAQDNVNNMLLSVSVFFSRVCICVQNMCAQGKFWKDTREIVETLPVESMTEGLEEH